MKTLSGSTSTSKPERYEPPWIHVHAVERWWRSDGCSPSSEMNDASAPPKATKQESVERDAAPRRERRVPPSVISSVAASGESRQNQAPAIIRAESSSG